MTQSKRRAAKRPAGLNQYGFSARALSTRNKHMVEAHRALRRMARASGSQAVHRARRLEYRLNYARLTADPT